MTEHEKAPRAEAAAVMIVDDHPAVREGLALRISRQSDLRVCCEASSILDALRAVEEHHPDVAVVDISLKDGNGIELVRRIKLKDDRIRILVWSMFPESLYAERALRVGALGYITKEHGTGKIVEAIQAVRDGKLYLSEDLASRLVQHALGAAKPGAASPVESLSNRELEVFELIGMGKTTGEIAEQLHVSVHTVETHRQRIKSKLTLKTSGELSRTAVQWVLEK